MSAKYRLLHVIDHLGSGGAQEVVGHLLTYGNRRLFQPEVVALHGFGHYYELFRSWGVPVYSLAPQENAGPAIPLIWGRLFRLLRRRRYDLVHCHLQGANLLATPLAALCRVPVRFTHDHTCDDRRGRYRVWRGLDRLANRLTHHLITTSASIREFLCREEKIPAHKVSVIYNGLDQARWIPETGPQEREAWRSFYGLAPGAPAVGGVGRLHYQKNFPLFLEVAEAVSRRFPQAVFLIAGEGPDRVLLEELSRRLGIAPKVRFLGFVKEMREFYLALDLLLFPTRFEGTCLTTLEALAMGVPVVASRVDGIGEILADGKDGLLIPPEAKEFFVAGVIRLLEDRALARRLARAGQKKVRRHFSAEAMVRQVEALYLAYLDEAWSGAR
jgi:glycosyltransferase involved in cell wall biosynthesis